MQTLSAILLSASLLLGGLSIQESNPAAAKVNDFLTRIVQTAMTRSPAEPELGKNIATVKTSADLYSSYNQATKVLAQLKQGEKVSIKCRDNFNSTDWVYVTAGDYHVSGWMLVSQLNMPDVIEDALLDSSETQEDFVPSYSKMGIVSNDYLNIRTAPGTGFYQVGAYRSGDRVGIIETNNGWGRTAKGWISLDYVYMDGQVGKNPMVGNVTADLLNVRSGPGLGYAVCGSYNQGNRVIILEQIYADGYYWGCTRSGWVCMSYISPDCIPGTATPIYGYGTVRNAALYVYPNAGTDSAAVGQIPQDSVVPVLEVAVIGGTLWGRTTAGWIDMTDVDMRAVYEQAIIPAPLILSVTPIAPPPEATTEATTEPTTEATTEATTEPTTEATTEPTTEATTEPTTEATTEAADSEGDSDGDSEGGSGDESET